MDHDVECRQIRAARALLDWSQSVLAEKAKLSLLTIKRIENEERGASRKSLAAVVRALEQGGVVFLSTGEAVVASGPGVALKIP